MNYRRIIPNSISALSLTFGVLSIFDTFEGNFSRAAIFIILAVIADSMDADMLMKASDLKLTGKYMETSYKGLSIDSVKAVNLN